MELLKSLVWRDVFELDSDKIGGQFQSHLGFGWFFSWFWQCQLCPRKRQLCSDESHELSQFHLLWMNRKVDDCVDYNAKYMHGNWEFCKINRVEGPLVKLWIQNKRSYQIRSDWCVPDMLHVDSMGKSLSSVWSCLRVHVCFGCVWEMKLDGISKFVANGSIWVLRLKKHETENHCIVWKEFFWNNKNIYICRLVYILFYL